MLFIYNIYMTQIYVDSLADLSSYKDIKVFPYLFDIEGKKYLTSELSSEDIYNYLSKGIYPKTSRPSLGIWSDMIEEDLKKGNDILYIGSTSKMTGALSSINVIKNLMKNKYPNRKIDSIDTNHISGNIDLIINDILLNIFNPDNFKQYYILKDTNTAFKNNRLPNEVNDISLTKTINGVVTFDSSYKSYDDLFSFIKKESSNNEKFVNICYSYDMKNSSLVNEIKDFYLSHNSNINIYMMSSCMYSYAGLGSIVISIKEN